MRMPLPSERLGSLSCWELSSLLSGAVTAASCSPGWSSQHCSPHHRGSPMRMPLPSERLSSLSCWELSSPLSGAVTVASCSPGWSSQHCSPHHRGSPMSMPLPCEHLRVGSSASQSSVIWRCSPYGRASIAPLTIESHLWATLFTSEHCDSALRSCQSAASGC